MKGTIILSTAGLALAGSIIFYFLMESDLAYVPTRDIYKTIIWGSIGIVGCVYIYSYVDGIITMNHLYKLFYPD